MLGFTQSRQRPLNGIEVFYQILPGSYKSDTPINDTGIYKVPSKCDCLNGSNVNGCRQAFMYSFALDKPLGCKIYKEPRIKLFEKINKSVLSHIIFYFEDGDDKPVDFKKETIPFTCQLIKISYSYFYVHTII